MTQFPALASIHEAARLLNVSTKTLRRWESRGVLVPIRSEGGHRRYDLNQVRQLKGNKKHIRLSSTPTPEISAKIDPKDIPVFYTRLHIDQQKAIRLMTTVLIFSLVTYTGFKFTPRGIVDSFKTKLVQLNISKNIAENQEQEYPDGKVLAAATGSQQPTFNINIGSAFKGDALFTQNVEVDGNLTLKKQIIGNVDLTGVVIVGGNSITSRQTTFNLLNTGTSTLNIGGAATTLNIGPTGSGTSSILLSGGVANTGCTLDGSTGALSCSGGLTGSTLTTTGKITGSGDLAISGNGTFGNITSIKGITYSFPTAQGGSSTFLTNNGSGTLTWTSVSTSLTSLSGVLPIANGGTNNSAVYTAGSVIFSNGTKLTQDNANFFWDDTNNRLGIGNAAPTTALDITGVGTFSSGLTLTTGALNLTSTSGKLDLTSVATTGNAYSFTNTSLTDNNSNALLLTYQNANTGAGTLVNGLRIVATGSTPSSGTNTQDLISLSGSTLGSNTFNGIYFNTGLSNFVNSSNWTVTAAGAETIASDLGVNGGNITTTQAVANIFTGATTLGIGNASGTTTINGILGVNGNTTLGDNAADTITFTGRVAQDSDLIPVIATGANDLGTALLPWDDIYAVTLHQGANLVCDASGANCPGGTQVWEQSAAGSLYPLNSSTDVLIGSSATSSAKFAFKNVLTGTPTASISGTTAFVSTYLTGEGNLATTNFANLTIGGDTTGNITLNPSNSIAGGFVAPNTNNVTDLGTSGLKWRNIYGGTITGTSLFQGVNAVCDASGANCPAAGSGGSKWRIGLGIIAPFSDTADVLIGSTATASAKFAFKNVYSGTPTASISGTTAFVSTYLTGEGNLATTNFANLTIGGDTTGNITLNPSNSIDGGFVAPKTTNVTDLGTSLLLFKRIYGTTIYQGVNQVCDTGGNCSSVGNLWQQNDKIVSPANSTYDLAIGGTATGSAFQVFGSENATSGIAKISSVLTDTGDVLSVNSTAITSGSLIKLGESGTTTFNGNAIFANLDSAGSGTFTGNFLRFDNSLATKFTVDASGNIGVAAGSGIDTLAAGSLAIGTTNANAISISKSGVTTTVNGALTSSETLIASNSFTLSAGALNLTSSSGRSNLTSTSNALDSFMFTNNSINTAGVNLANFTFQNNNTGAGVAVGGIKVSATGSTPSGGTNTANLLDISATALANNTFNGINFGNGLTNYINGANFTVTAAGNVSALGGMTVSGGTINLNYTGTSNTNIGNTTGTTTVAGNILPATTETTSLGSSSLLQFNSIFAKSFSQNGSLVCDSSGTNCPSGSSGGSKWKLSAGNGAISPFSDSLDVLIGNSATASAKFAFKNVLTGTPTASISGSPNIATYIDGNGNFATTNTQNLVLGNSATYPTGTGNILLNPNGTGNVGIGLTTPGQKLVVGDITGQNTLRVNGLTTADMSPVLSLFRSGAAEWALANYGSSFVIGNNPATYSDANLASAAKLTINASGQVGIGTTLPGALLDVAGTASVSGTLTVGNGTINSIRSPYGPLTLAYKSAADTWTTGLSLTDTTGNVVIANDLAVNGATSADITTTTDTATIFNSTAATLSLGGGATTAFNIGTGNTAYTGINIGTGTGGNAFNIGTNNTTKDTISIGSALDDVIINGAGTGSLINFANFDVATTGNVTVAGGQGIDTNAAGTLYVGNSTATAIGIGGTATTLFSIGDGGSLTRTFNIGTGTGADTFNIGTGGGADVINLGSSGSTTALNLTSGTGSQTFASSVVSGSTTTSAFVFTGNALTTGTGMYLNSSSITTGTLMAINASGTTLTTGKLLDVQNNSSSVFNVGASQITSAIPHQFTAAGDVTMAYDLVFTNQTASTIDSYGPLTIRSGESFESNNLTLASYNSGQIVINGSLNGTTVTSNTTSTGAGTVTVTGRGTTYYLHDTSGTTDTSYSTAINVTGVPTTEGTIVFLRTGCEKGATVGSRQHTCNIQVNGTQISSVATATGTGASTVLENYVAAYLNSSWRLIVGSNTTSDTADLAEVYKSETDVDAGEVVSLQSNDELKVRRALLGDNGLTIGVTSTRPAVLMGDEFDANTQKIAVALSGRVPVKIAADSPSIAIGDLIGASNSPGKAQKADSGFTVGRALEGWSPQSGKQTILMFVNPLYVPTQIAVEGPGSLLSTVSDPSDSNYSQLLTQDGRTVEKISGLKGLIVETFNALQGTVDNLLVKAGLVSPEVLTRNIKPLVGEKDVNITVGTATESGKLAIKNAEDKEVASIDSSGNASISGTLFANTIYADQIVSKDAKFGSTETDSLGGITRQQIEDLLSSVEQNQNLVNQAQNWSTNTATSSASLNELDLKNLYVTGITALDSLSVTNNVIIAGQLAISKLTTDNVSILTLDTLDSPLSIQSAGSQPLYIMAGKVKVDTAGNVQILGNLAVGGVLSASAISIAEDPSSSVSATPTGNILNSLATAGAARIASGSADITILNPNIKADSLIFVTPTSLSPQNLFVKNKDAGTATVGFADPGANDVTFNWWIVNLVNGSQGDP